MNQSIDINCDVGEGLGNEADLMPYISSCSIACGAHAGDEATISKTMQLALTHQVKIGAHPSFPDRANFGREVVEMPLNELKESIEKQIMLVKTHADSLGATLNHIKAHGALYNLAANDKKTAEALIKVIQKISKNVFLYVPYNSLLENLAVQNGLKIKVEAFADRNYNSDLTLVARTNPKAVITDPEIVVDHMLNMVLNNRVISIDGVGVKMRAQTYCIHGDNSSAISILKKLSKVLRENEIKIV